MIVLKFGGTSVQGPDMINRALDIAASRMDKAPILVSSAMAKVTDGLIKATQTAVSGDGEGAMKAANEIIERHTSVARDFLSGNPARGIDAMAVQKMQMTRIFLMSFKMLCAPGCRCHFSISSFRTESIG
ncbi:MAG: hypothetical protein LBT68_07975 [Spirochaetales bacterium]|jgi:aspartokinase|nr:hypothetical protein [Spirochaetales bacterium]